jgi:glycosyltransferase involved in cell wall biosynthesis
MRIGIMARCLDQHEGGVRIYATELLKRLALNADHEFVLLTKSRQGDSLHIPIQELVLGKSPSFIWDQWLVPRAANKEGVDLIFNLKYSLPLVKKCPAVFVCHGLDWYIMPWGSKWIDRASHQLLIPRYAKRADAIIAVSETVRQNVIEYLGVDESRVYRIYSGVDQERFGKPIPLELLQETKLTYKLPADYLLYCGQIYPPKNFGRVLQAYAQIGPKIGISLVIAGNKTWLCDNEVDLIDKLKIGDWVKWTGWVPHDTLPAFYAMAKALILPSLYEGFGFPILEAMCAGCPVVTSNCYATAELAEGAAILVEPTDIDSIADGMLRVLGDSELRAQLIHAGKERVKEFSWEKCCDETISVLESRGVAPFAKDSEMGKVHVA